MLRADYRERWHEHKHPMEEPALPQRVRVDLSFLTRNHPHRPASISSGDAFSDDIRGNADFKTVNRMQAPHPVLRSEFAYQSYLRHKGIAHPRAVAEGLPGVHPRTVTGHTHSWDGSNLDNGDGRSPLIPLPQATAGRSHTSMGFTPQRPAPLVVPPSDSPQSSQVEEVPSSSPGNTKAQRKITARRELVAPRPLRSPPLPPSLSRLSPVPTLSWNGTSSHHPIMPNSRNQGVWQEEFTPLGPMSLRGPISPGSGSILTPGIGRSVHSRGGGRWLEPRGMAAYNMMQNERSPPSSPAVQGPRAGGGGAKEMRQRTKGDRIWLSGQAWTNFT